MGDDVYSATVIGRTELNPDLIILRVKLDGPLFRFAAGQYTVLGLMGASPRVVFSDADDEPSQDGQLIRRAYSISSSSKQDEYLEFYISLVRSGALSPDCLDSTKGIASGSAQRRPASSRFPTSMSAMICF